MTQFHNSVTKIIQAMQSRASESKFDPSLVRVEQALELMNHPEHDFKSVHITGTNGKTSTAYFTAALIQNLGFKVGLFTSPHLVRINERIKINGHDISDADFIDLYNAVLPYVELVDQDATVSKTQPKISYFEFIVLMAFRYFSDEAVAFAVIEVGMGGSWDATNLITPEVSIITSIDIDHTEYLGNTLESIASEKAGIIKPQVPAVVQKQLPAARKVVEAAASKLKAPLLRVENAEPKTIQLAMRGRYQIDNMVAAILAVESIFGPLDQQLLDDTFSKVFVPGRLQQISQEPAIVVDIAHNPAGVAVMAQAVREYFDYDYLISVVGILQEKDVQPMLTTFVELADYLVLTQSQSPRALPVDQLVKLLPADFSSPNFETAENVTQALAQAVTKLEKFQLEHPEQKGLILISGSATVVGETLALLEPGA